ncbi:MAG: cupin domain-containing protein [Candidatus Latescibacteria bacterium]|jgi:quercetin dioxygenase-like cupin family protein|nr:cupin domain-containing protein [Candidatus Latescibacterota bacterium]MBT4139393.1 cupin domain-containing protein [Candidatus Latescibacterota bacterium]
MSFEVYDYRKDLRNVLVTPQIRSRFLQIEVGAISGGSRPGRGHSHDLGHEIFLILQGQAEFEIDGETKVVGPGQLCVALVDEVHTVRNVGDEPVIMYLSVTPHIQPTHTGWTEEGEKEPPRFNPSETYDVTADLEMPVDTLVARQLSSAEKLANATEQARQVQQEQLEIFKEKVAEGDKAAALEARDTIWAALCPMFSSMFALAEDWNELTYRTADPGFLAKGAE